MRERQILEIRNGTEEIRLGWSRTPYGRGSGALNGDEKEWNGEDEMRETHRDTRKDPGKGNEGDAWWISPGSDFKGTSGADSGGERKGQKGTTQSQGNTGLSCDRYTAPRVETSRPILG